MSISLKVEDPGKLLTDGLAEHVRERTEKLGHLFGRLEQCRVAVDGPGQHPLPGRFRVRIFLAVPESRIVINNQSGEDLPTAIRESFDAADHRLDDHARAVREARDGAKTRPSRKR